MIPRVVWRPREVLRPAAYNPRHAEDRVLDLLEVSLRKLGLLLPLYATRAGEIISGHQRHLVSGRVGLSELPVFETPDWGERRKAINIVFNRATCDMSTADTEADLMARVSSEEVEALASRLPDLTPAQAARRLEAARPIPVDSLRVADNPHARRSAALLWAAGVVLWIVVDPDGDVVVGRGAVLAAKERGDKHVPGLVVSRDEAALARLLMAVTGRFNLEDRYADLLRHNSFRRSRRVRGELGIAFTAGLRKRTEAEPAEWRSVYGSTVLDYGAGHGTEAELLRSWGVRVTEVEPYRITPGTESIDRAASIAILRTALADVAAGREFDSIIMASVLNSIPFEEDRRAAMTIAAALAGPRTNLWVSCSAATNPSLLHTQGKEYQNHNYSRLVTFRLGYERGIVLGDYSRHPKVQKFHTPRELLDLVGERWGRARIVPHNRQSVVLAAHARDARPVAVEDLHRALPSLFDLPYPDGSRLGLVQAAAEAFAARAARRSG